MIASRAFLRRPAVSMNVGLEVSAGPSDRTIPAFVAFDLLIFAEERRGPDDEEQQDAIVDSTSQR